MSNLLKIIKITKTFREEFGGTVEGLGYNTIIQLLEKEEKATPRTLRTLHREMIKFLEKHGIQKQYLHLETSTYNDDIKYTCFVLNKTVEANSPKKFWKKFTTLVENEAEDYKKKEVERQKETDISL